MIYISLNIHGGLILFMDIFVVVLRSLTHTYYVLVAEDAKSNNINPCLRGTYGNRRRNGKLYTG